MPASLLLVVGPARSGKTKHLLSAYLDQAAQFPLGEGGRSLWLSPTSAAAAATRDALAAAAQRCLLDPGVGAFGQFAAQVTAEAGLACRPLSAVEQRRLLRVVATDAVAAGRLRFFVRAALLPGFVAQLGQQIAEWKRRDLWAEKVAERLGPQTSPRDRETAILYAAYQQKLADAGLFDAEGVTWAARDALRTRPALLSPLGGVVVDGFSDFTAAELDILGLLARRAAWLAVSLPLELQGSRGDLWAKARATYEQLQTLGQWQVVEPQQERGRGPEGTLERVAGRLFGSEDLAERLPRGAATSTPHSITLTSAASWQAELAAIAAQIKQRLVAGEDPGELVMALRSVSEHADRVRAVFADYGVPVRLEASRRAAAAPAVRSVLRAWRLQADDWPYRETLAVVADRNLGVWDRFAPSGAGSDGATATAARAAIERFVREAQCPQDREMLVARLQGFWQRAQRAAEADAEGRTSAAQEAEAAASALTAIQRVATLLERCSGDAPLTTWIRRTQELAVDLGVAGIAAGDAGPFAEENHTVYASWTTALDDVARLEAQIGRGRRRYALAEFLELATEAAELTAWPEPRDATGRVRVLSVETARGAAVRRLWLAGLNERAFPAAARRASLASDGLADGARGAAGDAGDEMLLFYQLATRPRESLHLSYTALDAKGQAVSPSPYVAELERVTGDAWERIEASAPADDGSVADVPWAASDLRRRAALETLDGRPTLLAQTAAHPGPHVDGRAVLDAVEAVAVRSRFEGFAAHEGVLASPAVRGELSRRFGPRQLWSASQLETYAECPFKYFGRQLLQLEATPDARLQSDYLSRGSLLHEALALLHQELPEAWEAGEAELAEAFAKRVEMAYGRRRQEGVEGALRDIERRQILAWAENVAQQHDAYRQLWPQLDEPLRPLLLEVRFGPSRASDDPESDRSVDEAFEVELSGETLRLTGRIDRVDVGRVGGQTVFTVIDYKAGKSQTVNEAAMHSGKQLQLPLYVMAVADLLLAERQPTPLAAGYWSVSGGGFSTDRSKKPKLALAEIKTDGVHMLPAWSELRERTRRLLESAIADIRAGHFPVYNDDEQCGTYCELRTICRINHVRNLGKEWTRPEAEVAPDGPPAQASRAGAERPGESAP